MTSLFSIILHCIGDVLIGISILRLIGVHRINLLRIIQGLILGMFSETTLGFLGMVFGIQPIFTFLILFGLGFIFLLIIFYTKRLEIRLKLFACHFNLSVIECILLLLISIKIAAVSISLVRFPLYFDDAMTHWSGRAKALYGQQNWSMEPNSDSFLGKQFGYDEYPLLSVIWRADGAWLNQGWSELISRTDSFLYFLILLYSVYYLVNYLSKKRWAALAAVMLTTSLPLQFSHAISGYNEIALEALGMMFLICLAQKEYVIAGLITGAIIFTKNEGLILYFPLFFLMIIWDNLVSETGKIEKSANMFKFFLSSILLVLPWLLFKWYHNLPFTTPTKAEYYYHDGSVELFFEAMFNNPTSSIFWVMIFLLSVVNFVKIRKDHYLTMLTFLILSLMGAFIVIFSFTGANIWLVNQGTVHRSLLQIAPIGIVLVSLLSCSHKGHLDSDMAAIAGEKGSLRS